ncbi:MAG TPA: type II secretion system F family protein [Terriglobales bacterium]|nr:type II secretion system F family protein [Terriglobales bacterium]
MAEFLIKMADEHGRLLEQVEDAQSEAEARERFSRQGFLVYSVRPRRILAGGEVHLPRRRRVKLDEFVIFNQQFVTLIRAGLPILTALDLLKARQRNAYFRGLLEDVRDRVRSGELLSEAFAAQKAFPRLYTTTLLAGEKSGNLEEVMNRYIVFQRTASSVRKKLLASLVYPALLVTLVVAMLIFLVTYVVPEFAKLFESLKAQLPPLTLFMLRIGVTLREHILLVAGGVLAVGLLVRRWQRSPAGAERLDRLRLATPVLGDIWLKYQIAIFARMMSTLLAGGLPLVPALETAGASLESKYLSRGVIQAAHRVREGQPLSKSLEETGSFPELSVEMIEVGESTGALPAMLNSVAEFYEEDVQTALAALMSLIEPAILIFMGLVVAFVLLSLYLPIFTLGAGGVAAR